MKSKTKTQFLAIAVVLGLFVGTMGTQFVAAGNYQDTSYYISYSGDGSEVAISPRSKTDKTPVYVYNKGTKTQRTSVAGTNSISDYNGIIYNNCTYGEAYKDVSAGTYKYISSTVYEEGYSYAFLAMSTTNHTAAVLKGVWSPDSIGSGS